MRQIFLIIPLIAQISLYAEPCCVLILGMHRSGTSALSGALQLMGLNLGDNLIWWPEQYNPKGYFEDVAINTLNTEILADYNSTWDDPQDLNLFSDRTKFSYHVSKVKELITTQFGQSLFFGIKDPRICILLPIYLQAIKELKYTLKLIIIKRKPLEIAASLKNRDGLPVHIGLALVKKYHSSIAKYTRTYNCLTLTFNALINNTKQVLEKLYSFIPQLNNSQDIYKKVEDFIDKDLKHHSFKHR